MERTSSHFLTCGEIWSEETKLTHKDKKDGAREIQSVCVRVRESRDIKIDIQR